MAKITRIKASDPKKSKSEPKPKAKALAESKLDKKSAKLSKKAAKLAKKADKKAHKKPMPKWLRVITKPFVWLATPFIALGRYIHNSWLEIRQVRWPNRKATWKMVLAVLAYTGIFIAFIMILDAIFTLIFNNLLG